jgi:hypothetical protein
MYHPLFARVMLSLLLYAAGSDLIAAAADTSVQKREGAVSLSRVGSPRQLATHVDRLFSSSSIREVDRLIADQDCTVALAAGWERVRRTMPVVKQREPVSPDAQAIARFLGLIEGRLQIPITLAWEATVKSTRGYGRGAIWFSCPKIVEKSMALHRPVRHGDQWIVEKDGQTIKLAVEDRFGPVDSAAVLPADKAVYVALYGSRPHPFRVLAVDRDKGNVIRSYEVWAAGGLVDYQGRGWHHVEMHLTGETLTVFGISDGELYIEAFDRMTAKNRCRFGTAYFDASAPGE